MEICIGRYLHNTNRVLGLEDSFSMMLLGTNVLNHMKSKNACTLKHHTSKLNLLIFSLSEQMLCTAEFKVTLHWGAKMQQITLKATEKWSSLELKWAA